MERTYWHRQQLDKPLFPDLSWSRPENKNQAGKLLIIGGNLYGFMVPAEAFVESSKAGIGVTRVLLPDAIKKHVGNLLDSVEFAPSTPSGSFAQNSLAEWVDGSTWADAVLIAGNLGRNSETAIVLEKFIATHRGELTLTDDSVDYFLEAPQPLLTRPHTLLVITLSQLQKIVATIGSKRPITSKMDLLMLIDMLHDLSEAHEAHFIVKHHDTILIAVNGEISTTKIEGQLQTWHTMTASHATVWWLQNPSKPFEAMTTGLLGLRLPSNPQVDAD